MRYEDRWYQSEASDALLRDIEDYNPVVAIPTGGGKTIIMGRFLYFYLLKYPKKKALIVASTENILKQNHSAMQNFFPDKTIGLYSAGLNSKDIQQITVGGIQSTFRKPELFKDFDIFIVDECHQIPPTKKSMYRSFIHTTNPEKIIGLSATVFRRGMGYIYEGKNRLFNKLSYDLTSMDNFNRLVTEGYLCKLLSKSTDFKLKTKGIKVTAGDYNLKDLSQNFDRELITQKAIQEVLRYKEYYRSWLVFAVDIQHADNIHKELCSSGIASKTLHSKTPVKERSKIIDSFKNKGIQAIVSVGMITTGFDAPNIDLIVLLRPTKSPVLHVQMVGRGLRVAPDKDHCLVLDFAGNTKRLGPINCIPVPGEKIKGLKKGTAPVKECPKCQIINHIKAKHCVGCGEEFKFKQKIQKKSSTLPIMISSKSRWLEVQRINYYTHKKKHKPDSMKVVYSCGMLKVVEYICFDHGGYAGTKALHWVKTRWSKDQDLIFPRSVAQLRGVAPFLKIPTHIEITRKNGFMTVLQCKL